jgi:hypothetical protein
MRTGVVVHLSPTDRKRLRSIVDDRNSLRKHVWRARIVLATADGVGTVEIMRTAGVSKTAVWRWQARFMDNAVEGFFAILTRRRLKRGVFKGVVDLQAAINRFVVDHNQQSKPFVWTADPDKIIAAAARRHQVLVSIR